MEIVTREDAVAQGLRRYFTGKACKSGHVAERVTVSATCVECMRVATAANRKKARDAILARDQAQASE